MPSISRRWIAAMLSAARVFFALGMVAFGIQHLIHGAFVTRVIPKLPAWIPWHPLLAYLTGIGLIAAGSGILFKKGARTAATMLGWIFLLSFLFLYIPELAAGPFLGGTWTNAGKALSLSGGAFLVAETFTGRTGGSAGDYSRRGRAPNLLVYLSRLFLAAFLILAGVQHFLFAAFVAHLVPAWIPGHLFWTYFAGIALIAGGVGIILPLTTELAGTMTGIMIFLWVVLLHIPRAVAAPGDVNETTAVFEALAISGTAFLAAATAKKRPETLQGRYRSA